jgi:trimethylamine--corrinoid protein Co-methyltransferase
MFTQADLDDMHAATIEILDRTGVHVETDEALDIFSDGGCRVNRETHIVQIPPEVLADALAAARSSWRACGRTPQDDVMIEVGRVTAMPFAEGVKFNDLETGENRPSTTQDVADICHVADALDNLDLNFVAVFPNDAPTETAAVHGVEAALQHTTKPFPFSVVTSHEADLSLDLAAVAAGGEDASRERPRVIPGACPVAPLVLPHSLTDPLIATARRGNPWSTVAMGMAGGSTPITLAGTLVVQNAELLSAYVLTQLVNRGNAYYYGTSTCSLDLRWGAAAVGTPETALYQAGSVQLANYYGLTSWVAGY